MAKKWVEVAASPEFNALAPQQQEEARQQYWREVVAPNVPQDQLQSVQSEFDADTLPTIANPSAKPLDVEITGGQSVPAGDYAQMRQQEGAQVPYPTPTSPAANDSASARMISGQPAPQPEGNAVGRALGQIGGRQVLQGAYGLIGALGGDLLDHYVLGPVDRVLGTEGTSFQLGTGGRGYRQAASDFADSLGMYKPQTAKERIYSDVGEALTGTALTMGLGSLLSGGATAASSAASKLGDLLSGQPVRQVISTVGGATGSSVARESGADGNTQMLAGLAGGLGPDLLGTGGAAAVRGLVRGRNGDAMSQTIKDFESVGATPSVGQASGNRAIQGVESLLSGAPTSTGVMSRFAEKQAEDIGSGLRAAGAGLSRRSSGEDAGRAIQRGIHGPDGFIAQYKETQRQLYDAVDQHIPAGTGVDLSNTRQALAALNAPIKGAPNTSKLFQNGRIMGIEGALNRDLAIPTAPQQVLDDALAKLDSLYASRNAATQDSGRFAAYANDQANAAQRYYPVDGMPRFPARYTPAQANVQPGLDAASEAADIARGRVSSAQQIESTLGELQAAADAAGGRLPYEAIKKLRTLVGAELDDAGLASDLPRSKFKALYAALSKDLEGAAGEAGPDAMQAFRRANNYTRAGHERVDAIAKVIDRNGGPEAVFNAVMDGTRDGATTLRAVMQSIPRDAQRSLTAAVVKRMGMPTPGQAGIDGAEQFSAATFMTNWNRVSPEAKRALFDRYGPSFSKNMDQIARVANNIKQGSRVYANPSGTANRAAAYTYGASLVASMFDPTLISTGGLIGGGLAANGAARYLTDPRAVRWLAKATEMPRHALVVNARMLAQSANKAGDENMMQLAQDVENAIGNSGPAEDNNRNQ